MRFRLCKSDIGPLAKAFVILLLLSLLFYDTLLALPLLTPLAVPFLKKERERMETERARQIGIRFKDAILSIAASLRAGYSVENAITEAAKDMVLLYGKDSDICKELGIIVQGLHHNRTLEEMFDRFAERSAHPDIREFAEVFRIARRGGGNLATVIADTAAVIADRVDTERQIGVMIAGKRLEARLMEVIPLFIIFYIGFTNPGFFDPLYHNLFGIAFMSAALGIYLAAYFMAEKMIAIRL
ncbi:MAG: type II secretion system F family protein [Lachnospiraceae bacterium]|nr:type II secretion system F family protein [Lachnospiraceae bacterium]